MVLIGFVTFWTDDYYVFITPAEPMHHFQGGCIASGHS